MPDKYKVFKHSFKENTEQYRRRVHEKIKPHYSGNTLLDAGCADGGEVLLAAPCFSSIEAVDIEEFPEWKDFADEKINFRTASAENLPYEDSSFDTVLEKDMLHHAQDPEKAVMEMVRTASKKVILVEANRYNPLFYVNLTLMGNHQHFTRKRFKELAAKPGFPYEITHFSARVCPINKKPVINFFDRIQDFLENFPPYRPIIEYNMAVITVKDDKKTDK
ncbi:MAG: class I SAM-dependent methyltransferase [Candidatus Goldiibacteriota bacterium]